MNHAKSNRLAYLARLFDCALVLFAAAQLLAQPAQTREFPIGAVRRVEDLPAGRLRTQIDRLPADARDSAVAWLGNFHFTELDLNSLQVDPAGGIFYADNFTVAAAPVAQDEPAIGEAAVPISPFPAHLKFHSRAGAPNVLYINFSGETVSGTAWNTYVNRSSIPAVAFSTDGDYTTFSDTEQVAIKRIWQRMAEDYAPFNIDVTTERPSTFTTRTAHLLITRNTDANGLDNPASTSGGVAYVNVFGSSGYANYRPAWVYFNNLAYNESYIAEAGSHEIGHNLGLSHDGRTDGFEYYGGHGSGDTSWGPIMGTGYDRNVSQWSKGEYYLASNTEDDLAVIAGKISYRIDDHGNTASAATALRIIGGTNISSTTPENDPANTNTFNKGVFERNTDTDVFSFAAGTGPVDLTINPWIAPSGNTRGGNLDVVVELYDTNGVRLLTNNASGVTYARVQTNLVEGVYYLHVKNAGVASPTSSSPSGYTSYGSIGQYFITGTVVASGTIIPPGATLAVTDINQSGIDAKQFTVTYTDNVAVNVSTIDGADIFVTGTNGYVRDVALVSVDVSSDGSPRAATYSIVPPAGSFWSESDNGIYTIWMRTNAVRDIEGAAVPGGRLGEFRVAVPHAIYFANMNVNPGWTLESQWQYGAPLYAAGTGPTSGFTGTNIIGFNLSGNYPNRLDPAYATTPLINCSASTTVTLRFRRWLRLRSADSAGIQVSTNGTTWMDVWSSSSSIADNSWQEVQYALPAWVAGSPSVRLRWRLESNPAQNDIGWNIDDVEILGDGNVDTAPPAATLSIANITSAGSPAHSLGVVYTDSSAVKIASLGSSNLVVTGPSGYSNTVEFIGVDLATDGTPRVASYSVPAPSGTWDATDNGTYQVTIQENQVTDTFNNSIAEAVLGTFTVAISTNVQALVVSSTLLNVPEGSNALFTLRLAAQPSTSVTVTVAHVTGDADLIVQSGATNVFTSANWSNAVSVVLAALPDSDQTNSSATFVCQSDGLASVNVQVIEQDTTPDALLVITINNPAWGTVAPAGGSFPVGHMADLTATPATYFRFMQWTGNLTATNNPLPLLLSSNVTLQANFAEQTTTNGTPYWWLASLGYSNDLDIADLLIGANGTPLWQSYIAGLDPTDSNSQLRLIIGAGSSSDNHILQWQTMTGRLYTILHSTNVLGGFTPLPHASNLPPAVSTATNSGSSTRDNFYRLEIRKAQ
jgi:hypothetical protein